MDIKIGTEITLNDVEQTLCKDIAKRRFNCARSNKIHNAKMGPQSDEFTDLQGIASELAFCKLFNVYPDTTIYVRSSTKGEDKGDATLPSGLTVDVKVTKYETGRLLAVLWKKKSGDFFALLTGTFPTYTFRGFMRQEELLQESRIGNLGWGDGFMAEQHELYELSSLGEISEAVN